MEARLADINEKEILALLGYRGRSAPHELTSRIHSAWKRISELSVPSLAYKIFDIADGSLDELLCGVNIVRHLSGCREAVIFGATLGAGIDRELMRLQISDMATAVVLDAAASSAIEGVCDNFCIDIADSRGEATARFSPGYGDFPLGVQRKIAESLRLDKIGITLSEGGIMIPQKSVTAILGIK